MIGPRNLKEAIKNEFFARVNLKWRLKSGITVAIRSQADWIMFNDIFTDGEYDLAITPLIENVPKQSINVLDLGANSGFFALRCADLLLGRNHSIDLNIISVEPSPPTFDLLAQNFQMQETSKKNCGPSMD